MWLYRTGNGHNPIVLYDYQPREPEIMPRASFKGFKGYLQTDAYDGYNKLLKEKTRVTIEVTIVPVLPIPGSDHSALLHRKVHC